MNLLDFFDKAYIINLPQRTDRKKTILQEVKKLGPDPHGKVELFPAIAPREAAGFPSRGARGCFQSHLAVIRHARKNNLKNVLILEDDLRISEYFAANHDRVMDQLAGSRYGMIYFGHAMWFGETKKFSFITYPNNIITTHFLGISAGIFDRLIDFLETVESRPPGHPLGGPMHVDGAYSTFRAQHKDVVTQVANPSLGYQSASRSNIHPAWYDKTIVLRPIADAIRRLGSAG